MFQDKAADRLRHLHQGQNSGKCRGSCQNKEDRCECADRFHKNRRDIPECHGPVEEQADKQGIENGDNRCFRGGGDAAVDTAKDDNRAQEGEKAFAQHPEQPFFAQQMDFSVDFFSIFAVTPAVIDGIQHQEQTNHQTRNDAG